MQGRAAFLFPEGRIAPESVCPPSTRNEGMDFRASAACGGLRPRRRLAEFIAEGGRLQPIGPPLGFRVERFWAQVATLDP